MKSKVNLNFFKKVVLLLSLMTTLIISFQNCSNWNGSVAVLNKAIDGQSSTNPNDPSTINPPPKGDKVSRFSEIDMSNRTNFPDLKMFFIVDNSYTMKEAHENLASSFEKMYTGSQAENLKPFNTSIYMFSTAQFNGQSLSSLMRAKLPSRNAESINKSSLALNLDNDRQETLSGVIAGDIIGFAKLDRLNNDLINAGYTKFIEYHPAPVLSLEVNSTNNLFKASESILKEKNQDPESIILDFKNKLNILSPSRNLGTNFKITTATLSNNQVVKTTEGEFNEVIDKESGLCAVSRILKNNQNFVKPGDLASFIILTDEDDSDPFGQNCIQSESLRELSPSQNGTYQKLKCVKSEPYFEGKIKYQLNNSNQCNVSYTTGFTASVKASKATTRVKYNTEKEKRAVSYYTSSTTPLTYSTTIVFSRSSQNCSSNDGVISCSDAIISTATSTVSGDQTSTTSKCETAAAKLGAIIDPNYPVTCTKNTYGGVTTYSQKNETIDASLDCNTHFSSKSAVLNNSTYPTVCSPSTTKEYTAAYTTDVDGAKDSLCPSNNSDVTNTFISSQLNNISYSTDTGYQPSCVDGANNNKEIELASINRSYSDTNSSLPELNPSVYPTASTYSLNSSDQKLIDIVNALNNLNSNVKSSSTTYSSLKFSITHTSGQTGILNLLTSETCDSNYASTKCNSISGCKYPNATTPAAAYSTEVTLVTTGTSKTMDCNLLCSDVQKIVNGGKSSYCGVGNDNVSLLNYINNNISNSKQGSCSMSSVTSKTLSTVTFGSDAGFEFSQSDYNNYVCSAGAKVAVGSPYQKLITAGSIENIIASIGGENLSGSKKVPDQPLYSYIDQRSTEILGQKNKPLFTLFTPKSMDFKTSNYGQLLNLARGQVADLNSGDYSPALEQLSSVIKERLSRSIQIENFQEGERVLHIWRKSSDGLSNEEIKTENWTQNGSTILFNENFKINLNDKFRIEIK